MTSRRFRSFGVLAAVAALVVLVAYAATRADGREGTEARANDGGAWLLKRDAGAVGHLNRAVLEVTTGVRVSEPGSDFDVDQADDVILVHDRSTATITLLDPRTHLTQGSLLVPETAEVLARNGGMVIWQTTPLTVWDLSVAEMLATTDLATVDPDFASASNGTVSVGPNVIAIHVTDEQSLVVLGSNRTLAAPELGEPVDAITSVGSMTIVAAGDQLLLANEAGANVEQVDGGPFILQQPSAVGGSLALIGGDGTIRVIDLDSGRVTTGPRLAGAGTQAPIHHDGCVFAVVADPPTFTRVCDLGSTGEPVIDTTPLTGAGAELRLRLVNGWVWVNDIESGGAWLSDADTDLARIDDWGAALAEHEQEDSDATTENDGGLVRTRVAQDSENAELVRADEQDEDGVNDPPIARDDETQTRVDRPVIVSVLDNDEDADGDVLLIDNVEPLPAGGTSQAWLTSGSDAIQVTPAAGFTGTLRFAYRISDGRGGTAEAIATVIVNAGSQQANRPPSAQTDVVSVRAGSPASLNVLANDHDPDGDALVLMNVTSDGGSTIFDASGQVTFTPYLEGDDTGEATGHSIELGYIVADDFGATAEGRIRVNVRLAEANGIPDARNDAAVTSVDRPIRLDLLANDTDPDNDPLIVARQPLLVHGPVPIDEQGRTGEQGLAGQTTGGEFTFVADQPGVYLFEYVVSDGRASDTAQIRIDVTTGDENLPPLAVRDDVTIARGSTRLVRVLDNDGDPNGDIVGIVEWSGAEWSGGGALTIEEVPGIGFRVTAAADAPDRLVFRYAISDGQAEPVGTVVVVSVVDVETINQPPIVRSDAIEARAGRTTTVPVLLNDYDPEGGSLEVLRVSAATGLGEATTALDVTTAIGPTGQTLTITVGPSVTSSFRLGYDVTDSEGASGAAVVEVRVLRSDEPNRPPVARPDTARTTEAAGDHPGLVVSVLANDSDPDGDALALESVSSQPLHGEAEIAPDGTILYRPDDGFTGTDRFTYVVIDTDGGRAIGQALLGVTPRPATNRPPSANDDTIPIAVGQPDQIGPGAPVLLDLLANDHDPDNDVLTVVRLGETDRGTLELTDDGRVLFRPPGTDGSSATSNTTTSNSANSNTVSFVYTVTDSQGHTDDAVVRLVLTLEPEALPPIALDDHAGPTLGNRPLAVDVLANDTDPDGDPARLRLSSTDPAAVVVDGRLVVSVGPTSSQHRYTITDDDGLTASATLTVFVVENEAPRVANLRTTTTFDTPVTVSVAPQTSDPDGDQLFFVCCDNAQGGSAEIVRSGAGDLEVRFVPSPGFAGQASFRYTVDDQAGHVVAGFVGVTVDAPANRPPKASSGRMNLEAGTSLPFDLASLVEDPDSADAHTYRVESLSSGLGSDAAGELAGSTVTISALPNAVGQDQTLSFRVTDRAGASSSATVAVVITPITAAPPRAIADHATTNQGTSVTIDVTGNDIDPLGRGVTIANVGSSVAGSATVDGAAVRFIPRSDFFGTATLTYTLRDSANTPEREAVGQVTIDVIGRPADPNPPGAIAGNATATITWTTPTANGAVVDGYRVETASADGATTIDLGPQNSHEAKGLTNGADYRFRLAAHNAAGWGEWSPWSSPVRPDARPEPPGAPQIAYGDGELTVTWRPSVNVGSAITGYLLEIGGGVNQIVSAGTAGGYTWPQLDNGVEYQFRIAAVNAAGVSEWSRWSATEHPFGAPYDGPAPSVTRGNRSLELAWAPPANNGDPINTYEIEIRSTGQRVPVAGATSASYRWANLTNGVAQEFRVRAINRAPSPGAWSPWSAPIVPCSVPDAPATPTASRGDTALGVGWVTPDAQGCGILRYNLRAVGGGDVIVQTSGAGTTTHSFTGLANGVPYSVQVQAVNEEGAGPWSAPSITVVPAGPPTVPTIDSASAQDVGQVTLRWSGASGNGSTIVNHEVSINTGVPIVAPGAGYLAGGLAANTTYSFRVRACNAVGCGGWSGSMIATTWGPPSAPRAVSASGGNATWALSWSTPASDGGSPVTGYELRVNGGAVSSLGQTTFGFNLPGALNGTTYTGEVRACSGVGCGPWSSASATPTAPPPVVSIAIGANYTGSGCVGTCNWVQLTASNFAPGSSVSVQCHDTRIGLFKTATATIGAGGTLTSTPCFYGYDGDTMWITVNGVESNRILWP